MVILQFERQTQGQASNIPVVHLYDIVQYEVMYNILIHIRKEGGFLTRGGPDGSASGIATQHRFLAYCGPLIHRTTASANTHNIITVIALDSNQSR